MKRIFRFRDIEQISYALIGFIPYLLAFYLISQTGVEITTITLLVAAAALMAHLIGYSIIHRFGQQLKHVREKTRRALNSDIKTGIELDEKTPDELAGIVHHFNTMLAESERASRNFQEMTTKMMLYARDIDSYQQRLSQEECSRNRLSRYLGQNLVDNIINSKTDLPLKNRKQEVTVLFADIRSFTAISERLEPEQVVNMLNDYFDAMVKIIFRHHGVLDKFVGDELMATFGLVDDPDEGPMHALQAAIAMQASMKKLMSDFKMKGYPVFEIGIGINNGDVVVGNVGSRNRMDYTVIGDTVNVAARLEQMAEGGVIVAGEELHTRCGRSVVMMPKGEIQVKNRKAAVKCYRVIA